MARDVIHLARRGLHVLVVLGPVPDKDAPFLPKDFKKQLSFQVATLRVRCFLTAVSFARSSL